ncbi:MAG TPA: formylglycine-generating enzyme family protein [Terriglobales bacterium]|nr:formylglycine-generating enzyme family protein [Terriglobales bacterium]
MRNVRLSDDMSRHAWIFALVLVGGLAVVSAQRENRSRETTSNPALSSMIWLRGGTVTIGIDQDEIARFQKLFSITVRQLFEGSVPKHKVRLQSFFIDKYLVTNSQFQEFINKHPEWQPGKIPPESDNGNYLKHWRNGSFPSGKANHPVVNVNWYAATAYCRAQGKRLPAEAEWEYASRGGLTTPLFPWGEEPANPERANYSAANLHTTSPVGSHPPNGYGIYDMAGNVWEFMADEWARYSVVRRSGSLTPTPSVSEVRARRVIRGGSFDGDPINLWVEYRDSHPPDGSQPFVGFRCAK